ncbi:MAG: RidA family protein [Christensenellaceae bacterium]|nr:RidA family protein [Christensenellaceae bacterium]
MNNYVNTKNAPAAIGPYSQARIAGGMIYVSGQLPVNMDNGEMETDIQKATHACLSNVKAILEAAGSNMSKVVKTTVYLTDMSDFPVMNEVYNSFFQAPYPARVCVAVKTLPKNVVVEIDCIAEM